MLGREAEASEPRTLTIAQLVIAGAAQVGSPWILGAGGSQSFTDEVHEDHIHLQQTPTD